jgi:hypothetical protein
VSLETTVAGFKLPSSERRELARGASTKRGNKYTQGIAENLGSNF